MKQLFGQHKKPSKTTKHDAKSDTLKVYGTNKASVVKVRDGLAKARKEIRSRPLARKRVNGELSSSQLVCEESLREGRDEIGVGSTDEYSLWPDISIEVSQDIPDEDFDLFSNSSVLPDEPLLTAKAVVYRESPKSIATSTEKASETVTAHTVTSTEKATTPAKETEASWLEFLNGEMLLCTGPIPFWSEKSQSTLDSTSTQEYADNVVDLSDLKSASLSEKRVQDRSITQVNFPGESETCSFNRSALSDSGTTTTKSKLGAKFTELVGAAVATTAAAAAAASAMTYELSSDIAKTLSCESFENMSKSTSRSRRKINKKSSIAPSNVSDRPAEAKSPQSVKSTEVGHFMINETNTSQKTETKSTLAASSEANHEDNKFCTADSIEMSPLSSKSAITMAALGASIHQICSNVCNWNTKVSGESVISDNQAEKETCVRALEARDESGALEIKRGVGESGACENISCERIDPDNTDQVKVDVNEVNEVAIDNKRQSMVEEVKADEKQEKDASRLDIHESRSSRTLSSKKSNMSQSLKKSLIRAPSCHLGGTESTETGMGIFSVETDRSVKEVNTANVGNLRIPANSSITKNANDGCNVKQCESHVTFEDNNDKNKRKLEIKVTESNSMSILAVKSGVGAKSSSNQKAVPLSPTSRNTHGEVGELDVSAELANLKRELSKLRSGLHELQKTTLKANSCSEDDNNNTTNTKMTTTVKHGINKSSSSGELLSNHAIRVTAKEGLRSGHHKKYLI